MSFVSEAELIARIHQSHCRLVLAATGGGSGAVSSLLKVPGASGTLLAAAIPYCAAAMDEWLGVVPEQYCSIRTARLMAMRAFQKAVDYGGGDDDQSMRLVGIGCTASLVSDREKKGPHRFHIGLQSASATVTWSVHLEKGKRTRAAEEDLTARHVLNAVAEGCGLTERLNLALGPADHLEEVRTLAPRDWQGLFAGRLRKLLECQPTETEPAGKAVFSGAFDPLHEAHREMASVARKLLGVPVEYEISICNVDKPSLDFTQMRERAETFAGQTLWFTRAPSFVEKARLFPGATFVVGADTVTRIADPRYYGGDEPSCRAAIEEIAAHGCRFLVFGRTVGGAYVAADSMELARSLAALCRPVPEDMFRRDISSTELRAAGRDTDS